MDVGREDFIRNRVMQVAFSILQTSTLAFFSFSFPLQITLLTYSEKVELDELACFKRFTRYRIFFGGGGEVMLISLKNPS